MIDGGNMSVTDEAMRFYGSPTTITDLLEATGGPFPLLPTEFGYERETFLVTPRTSEGFSSATIDGVLPVGSILNGTSIANYFPLDAFSRIEFSGDATGASKSAADYAASDWMGFTLERFRSPVPYSRIHYAQDLTQSFSNLDGLFSWNPSQPVNLTLALNRRSAGHAPSDIDQSFNPRIDYWSARAQMSWTKYLRDLPHDSTWTQHKTDSLLATPEARRHTLDFLVWGQYTTGFSGLSGGVASHDSIDIFTSQLAPMVDPSTYEHRVRIDGLAELDLPLLAEARTRLAAYASYESRSTSARDVAFPFWVPLVSAGSRDGLALIQPIDISFGAFLTHATIRGDAEVLEKGAQYNFAQPIKDTRLSATFSDSLALRTAFRISLFGFARTIESNLTETNSPTSSLVLPSVGLTASIGLTEHLAFTASYNYARDRVALSPSPGETYELRNLGGWFDLRVPLSRRDSIALHAGVLDRHEPEGIVLDFASDSAHPHPRFSSADLHTQSANLAVDAYFGGFHIASSLSYFPSVTPLSQYTRAPVLASDLSSRLFGFAGLYYEFEAGEGNLRLTVGPRGRFLDRSSPQLTYDPASDYFVYRGLPPSMPDTVLQALNDSRIATPKYILDFLASAEVDRRAQITMSLLNILGAPYYNVSLYPRQGFHWRVDVTWAFLD